MSMYVPRPDATALYSATLRNCPFCGAVAHITSREATIKPASAAWAVSCGDSLHCPYAPQPLNNGLTLDAAVTAWNGPL